MVSSPFLTTAEAASFLKFLKADGSPDIPRFLKFAYRYHVPRYKRGRTVLVDRAELESLVRRNLLKSA